VQAFLRMVADRRGKVLEITPRSAVRSSPLGIGSAGRAGDFTQASLAEELKESSAALGRFLGASLIRNRVGEVNGNHVGDRNLGYVALTARWCVLAGGVFGERRLSFSTLAHAEASAMLVSGVFDDPDCSLGTLVLSLAGRSKPESDSLGALRHRPNILCTSATDVQSLPATLEITSRPRLASVRNAAAVSPNCAATTPSRCGVSLSMTRRVGEALMAPPIDTKKSGHATL
jgi:hypothetical protein